MKALVIKARGEGYSTSDCGASLTVGELIGALSCYSDNTPVYVKIVQFNSLYASFDEFDIAEERA